MLSKLQLLCLLGLSLFKPILAETDSADSSRSCTKACSQLDAKFKAAGQPGVVTGLGGTANLTNFYWAAQQGTVIPACFVKATCARDVRLSIAVAEQFQCQFAVRSAGHGSLKGSSNSPNGITIDLSSINDLTVSADKKSVTVGPGLTWKQVYGALDAQGLAVIGAYDGDVGVGGSLVGGAFSMLSNLHGWGSDNVLSYELVLGDKILTVTSTSYSDLWFALKAGGNNLGIVTHYTLAVFPQGPIWGGSIFTAATQFSPLIDAMVNMTTQASSDPKAAISLAYIYDDSNKRWIGVSTVTYASPVVNPPILQNLTAIPSLGSTMAITNVTEISIQTSSDDIQREQETFWNFAYKHDPNVPHTIQTDCVNKVTAFANTSNIAGFKMACIFVPLTKPFLETSIQKGGNPMGLSAEGPIMLFFLSATWDKSSDEKAVLKFAGDLMASANTTAHKAGVGHPYIYLNHAAAEQNPFFGYGQGNLDKLRAVSRKYDPSGVFRKLQPGGFKL